MSDLIPAAQMVKTVIGATTTTASLDGVGVQKLTRREIQG